MASTDKRPNYGQRIPRQIKGGYLRVWAPNHPMAMADGLVLIHRMVWYDSYGEIPKGYHVHHKNRIPTDNRVENLELISNSDHHKEHHQEGKLMRNQYGVCRVRPYEERASTHKLNKQRKRICVSCKGFFLNKRRDAKYCSSNCQVGAWKRRARFLQELRVVS